jgi:hypothetical protein
MLPVSYVVRNSDVSGTCHDISDNRCNASLSFSYTLFLRHVWPLDMCLPTHVADSCCSINSSGLPHSRISFAKVKGDSDASRVTPLSPMNVAVHTTREDDSLSRKTDSRSLDEQLGVEAHRLEPEEEVTSSEEKVVSIVESPV